MQFTGVDGSRVDSSVDTGTEVLSSGRDQTLYIQAPFRRRGRNNSLGVYPALACAAEVATPGPDLDISENQPVAITHSFAYEGPPRAQTLSYYRTGHRPTRSLSSVPPPPPQAVAQTRSLADRQFNQDKPLPLLPPQSKVSEHSVPEPIAADMTVGTYQRKHANSDVVTRILRDEGEKTIASVDTSMQERLERADMSMGSWLDGYEQEKRDSFLCNDGTSGLDNYLSLSAQTLPSPQLSTTTERPHRQQRVVTPSSSPPFVAHNIDHIRDQLESLSHRARTRSLRSAKTSISSFTPQSMHAETGSVPKGGTLTRPGSEGEALSEGSLAYLARQPKVDPSNFPDPYPRGISSHQGTPALSSAGSSSTRSSAYTNAGSTFSASGYSGDYSHVRVASGDDFEGTGGIGGLSAGLGSNVTGGAYVVDGVMEKFARTSTGSSISRKSHVPSHAQHVPMTRTRRAHTLHSQSQSQPEDFNLPPIPIERRPLRSQPSYDTSWQREHEDLGTSEDEDDDYGQAEDAEDGEIDVEEEEEEQPGSAVSLVEEGRGLVVHGEGRPILALDIQPGVTHLLVGGSSTPNHVPAFLTTKLPQICSTLLALDISANFLVSLSPALASCASLEELNISANPLRVLPEFLAHLTSLRLLLADSTGISMMPATLSALQKLHTLSIRRNKMHALPSWLCTLPCLENLLVDGNPFQGPWKALVEPLLAKVPMTPAYPPSTPMISPPSVTPISATNTTSVETSDASDTEDYTDQDEMNHPASSTITPSSLAVPASGDENFEEHTLTPGQARLLEVSATTASADGSSSPPPARPLSRTRTAPNRGYYERVKQSRTEQEIAALSSPSLVSSTHRLNDSISNAAAPSSPNLMVNPSRDLRRMRSADELRRIMSPSGGAHPAAPFLSPPASPPRPAFKHFATDSVSLISEGTEGASLQRRFASLNMHTSRASSTRLLASNLFNVPPPREEDGDADVESPPPTLSRGRAATTVSITRGARDEEYERQIRQSLAKPRREKDKSNRKWGFLKKMSMGKLRSGEGASGSASVARSTRPSTSSGTSQSSLGKPTIASASVSVTPRQLSPPQVEVALPRSESINASSASRSPTPSSLMVSNLLLNASTDRLKVSSPTTPPATSLLAPPSPMAKTGKRRSFLPIDGPPALNIPIPSTSSFLGGITATNGSEDQDDGTRLHSPGHIVDSPQDFRSREEEQNREANARALRSVMAYLRDMNDLTLLSQGNSISTYGGAASLMDRSRRTTVADSQRMASEQSIDSIDSASSAPTTASSHLRSPDSFNANRSGSLNTMSVATSDSGGSGVEERKAKDDRGKRLMIVREIVETERTYVKNLQELVDIYVRPAAAPVTSIGNVASSSKDTVVPAAERKIVFGGLEVLHTFHKESFFPALEEAARPLLSLQGAAADADSDGKLSSEVAMAVGRTFIAHAAFMKMYSTYINNFDNSVSRIRQWVSDRSGPGAGGASITPSASTTQLANVGLAMSALAANSAALDSTSGKANLTSSQRKRIKHYLKRCRMNPRHSQLNLEGYLLLPVQRIPRYRLLLEDLTRSTPPPESYDDPLDRALNEISSLATNMNEGKREAESRKKLVMWQSRIRGKFPSPLVQPHRRLIMDGKLVLTRIVRKQTMAFEVLDSHGDASSVAVDCLAPELTPRPLYGILCNDLFVLCRDPSNGQDPNSLVDLWAVLRMQTMPQPTSIVHGNTLRIVDSKAILYLEASSTSDALTWFRAINMQVPAQKFDA